MNEPANESGCFKVYPPDQWADWSYAALLEYEESLYDRELDGEDTWAERDEVLWEISGRKPT